MLSGAMVAEVLEPDAALRRISLLLVPVAVVDAAGAVVWTTGVGVGGEPQAARSTTRGITAEACIGAPSVKLGTVPPIISTAVATMPAITLSADANSGSARSRNGSTCAAAITITMQAMPKNESRRISKSLLGEPISFATAIKPGNGNILRAQTALANVPAFSTSSLKFPLRGVPHFSFGATARE